MINRKAPFLLTLESALDHKTTKPFLDALGKRYPLYTGEEFLKQNADAEILDTAAVAVVFLSSAFLSNEALCHALLQLSIRDCPILLVYLEELELSPGMQLKLSLCPVFFPNRHPNEESAVSALADASYIRDHLS